MSTLWFQIQGDSSSVPQKYHYVRWVSPKRKFSGVTEYGILSFCLLRAKISEPQEKSYESRKKSKRVINIKMIYYKEVWIFCLHKITYRGWWYPLFTCLEICLIVEKLSGEIVSIYIQIFHNLLNCSGSWITNIAIFF